MKHKKLVESVTRLSVLPRKRVEPFLTPVLPKHPAGVVQDFVRHVQKKDTVPAGNQTVASVSAAPQASGLRDIVFTEVNKDKAARFNDFGIQMIPESLQRQLFPNSPKPLQKEKIDVCLTELHKFGLNQGEKELHSTIDITLPSCTSNLPRFFDDIAAQQLHPYTDFIKHLVAAPSLAVPPAAWSRQPGWTKYTESGSVPVPHPTCSGIVFDVEVCIKDGNKLPGRAPPQSYYLTKYLLSIYA